MTRSLLIAAILASTVRLASAAEVSLAVVPADVTLSGPRSEQQLVVTLLDEAGHPVDVTAGAIYESSDPAIVRVEHGRLRPAGNGAATVTVRHADRVATARVQVQKVEQPAPISFRLETQMALTKAGCNQGACHGSPSGKGGFRLSLRAYDPDLDLMTLRAEFHGRRTNPQEPEGSLLLRKPLMEVAHAGGQRLTRTDAAYHVLRDWIREGMRVDPPNEPELTSIELFPPDRVLHQGADRQQMIVTGVFSDGSRRDLTTLADFSSSSEGVATAAPSGLVSKQSRGETTILARYLDKIATSRLAFLEEVPGFAWTEPEPAHFIDRAVNGKLKQLQIQPSELCTDAEFLRRVYLDVTGQLPPADRVEAFLNETSPAKRMQLVDELLDTEAYASFWSLKWCDLLRANTKKLKTVGAHKFRQWVRESVYHDKPFDQFARELLVAEGSTLENPPANYWRASRDPQDATETTAQLFLGVRIQCAKCHNHPFERWTQDNYYGIAAAFARIDRKGAADGEEEFVFRKAQGEVVQPRTGRTMPVHLLLKGDVAVPPETDRRAVFAEWLTSAENPFFARSVVNRIWAHVVGRGIVEPVDDFRDSNPPSNPELLDELARQFATQGFSQKRALRQILTSATYQRSARTNAFNAQDDKYFSHARPRLLTAEQLLDAVSTVTEVREEFAGLPAGTAAIDLPEPPVDHPFLKIFGQPAREMACQCERSSDANLSQALQMINGPTVHGKLKSDQGRIARMLRDGKSADEIFRSLYLSAVTRQPSAEEAATAQSYLQQSSTPQAGLEDLAWALLNTKEFLFQH